MELVNKKRSTKYDRVMSRLNNRSRTTLESSSLVTRHQIPASARSGAKVSSTNFSSGGFSELPIVLNDYKPENTVQRTYVVKPRRTIKSLDPVKSPHRIPRNTKELLNKSNFKSPSSVSSMLHRDKTTHTHLRECLSTRSHSKLKELKEEIEAYQKTERMMKLRSRLYKSCGVMFDEAGQVSEDKAVQVEAPEPDKESTALR